jgi:hypothetical protein
MNKRKIKERERENESEVTTMMTQAVTPTFLTEVFMAFLSLFR